MHLLVVPHGNEEDDEDDNNDDDEEKEKEHLDADERKGCRARMVTNTSHPAHHHAHHELEDVINGSMRMDLSTDVTTLSVDTLSYASPTCTAQPAPPLNLTFTTIASGNMSALGHTPTGRPTTAPSSSTSLLHMLADIAAQTPMLAPQH